MMKRKADDSIDGAEGEGSRKRTAINPPDVIEPKTFRESIFGQEELDQQRKQYSESKPFNHGVIKDLISPELLCDVRSEIQQLPFTLKETDIYRIHQSHDLANLDGLEDASLKLLPSLFVLRDALYSSRFRKYLSQITQAGPLSGKKMDMAINVYTPGCHLLCHDDDIGSRRVSYILYLTDPNKPWKEEWGGALRLYPTSHPIAEDQSCKMTLPDPIVSIPPGFNQLSFFAIRPGESFHDVEEVFSSGDKSEDEIRVRTAISGWFHVPQEGEDGFEALEVAPKLTEKSSLTQFQGKEDAYELPSAKNQPAVIDTSFGSSTDQSEEKPFVTTEPPFSEHDLNFLLKYINPEYLMPEALDDVANYFTDKCSMTLYGFLSQKFSDSLREYILIQESHVLPAATKDIESTTPWTVARPPHKHRFLFFQGRGKKNLIDQSPLQDLLENLLPSLSFQKWLQLATGQVISSHNLLARRFRRGKDYTRAARYDEEDPQLEITLAITPTSGWEPQEAAIDHVQGVKEHTSVDKERSSDEGHAGGEQEQTGPDERHTADDGPHTGGGKEQTGPDERHTVDDGAHAGGEQEQIGLDEGHIVDDGAHAGGEQEQTGPDKQYAVDDGAHTSGDQEQTSLDKGHTVDDEAHAGDDQEQTGLNEGHIVDDGAHTYDEQEHVGPDEGYIVDDATHTGGNQEQIDLDEWHIVDDGAHTDDDQEQTGPDEEQTGPDEEQTGPDGKQTGPDEKQTGPDEEQTGSDEEQTGPDEEQTGPDEGHTVDAGAHAVSDTSHTAGEKKPIIGDKEPAGGDVGGYVSYLVIGEEDDMYDDTEPTDNQGKRPRSDPAVYQEPGEGDEEAILFNMPAAWNRLDIVLRDKGVMQFVKYVSQQAPGDRWDIFGEFSVDSPDDEEDEEDVGRRGETQGDRAADSNLLEDTDETELITASESETTDDY